MFDDWMNGSGMLGSSSNTSGFDLFGGGDSTNQLMNTNLGQGVGQNGMGMGMGNVMGAFDLISKLFGGYTAMKGLGLQEDMFEKQVELAEKDRATQAQTMNTYMKDRQNARVATGDPRYQSVEGYMNDNRVVA